MGFEKQGLYDTSMRTGIPSNRLDIEEDACGCCVDDMANAWLRQTMIQFTHRFTILIMEMQSDTTILANCAICVVLDVARSRSASNGDQS